MTLERLEMTVAMGCLTLTELALDQPFAVRDTWVRINDEDQRPPVEIGRCLAQDLDDIVDRTHCLCALPLVTSPAIKILLYVADILSNSRAGCLVWGG